MCQLRVRKDSLTAVPLEVLDRIVSLFSNFFWSLCPQLCFKLADPVLTLPDHLALAGTNRFLRSKCGRKSWFAIAE